MFKGDDIILAVCGLQFLQAQLQAFPRFFKLLYGKVLTVLLFGLCNGVLNLVHLLSNQAFLTLFGQRDFFKLAVADDNGVVVAGGNAGAELLSVSWFKILLAGDKQFGVRVQAEKLAGPLLGQMVRHDEKTLLAQAKTLGFHCG